VPKQRQYQKTSQPNKSCACVLSKLTNDLILTVLQNSAVIEQQYWNCTGIDALGNLQLWLW